MTRDQLLVAQVIRDRWNSRRGRNRVRIDEIEQFALILVERFAQADTAFDAQAFARVAALRLPTPEQTGARP